MSCSGLRALIDCAFHCYLGLSYERGFFSRRASLQISSRDPWLCYRGGKTLFCATFLSQMNKNPDCVKLKTGDGDAHTTVGRFRSISLRQQGDVRALLGGYFGQTTTFSATFRGKPRAYDLAIAEGQPFLRLRRELRRMFPGLETGGDGATGAHSCIGLLFPAGLEVGTVYSWTFELDKDILTFSHPSPPEGKGTLHSFFSKKI